MISSKSRFRDGGARSARRCRQEQSYVQHLPSSRKPWRRIHADYEKVTSGFPIEGRALPACRVRAREAAVRDKGERTAEPALAIGPRAPRGMCTQSANRARWRGLLRCSACTATPRRQALASRAARRAQMRVCVSGPSGIESAAALTQPYRWSRCNPAQAVRSSERLSMIGTMPARRSSGTSTGARTRGGRCRGNAVKPRASGERVPSAAAQPDPVVVECTLRAVRRLGVPSLRHDWTDWRRPPW